MTINIPTPIKNKKVTIGMVLTVAGGMVAGGAWAYDRDLLPITVSEHKSDLRQLAENLEDFTKALQGQIDVMRKEADYREIRRLRTEKNDIILRIKAAESENERPKTADLLRLQQIDDEIEDLQRDR